LPRELLGLTPSSRGFAVALWEPGEEASLELAASEEALLLEIFGEAYA